MQYYSVNGETGSNLASEILKYKSPFRDTWDGKTFVGRIQWEIRAYWTERAEYDRIIQEIVWFKYRTFIYI